jgi:DNA-binding beta-propeller fold protein YncE
MMRARVLGLLVLAGGCAAAASDGMLRAVQKTPLPGVEGRFDHFAMDPSGGRLFLAALGNDTLEVLDGKSGRRLGTVKGLQEPQGVAYAPDLKRVFVGNGRGGTCDILDGQTLTKVGQVPGLDDADNVRYDSAAKRIYVGYGSGALSVIDAAGGRQLATIPLQGHPESFQLAKSGPRIWVNVPAAGHVAVVDRKQGKVTDTWPVTGAGANFPMALDEQHHRLFIGCRRPARLLVYDTESGKQVTSVEIVGDTDDLFYDAPRKRIYVAGGEGAISVLEQRDADHYVPAGRIPTAPGARTAYFAADWNRLFLAVPHRGAQGAEVRVFEPQ